MGEYLGNTFSELEKALTDGKKGFTLNQAQMVQILQVVAEVTEGKNEAVRENIKLRLKLEAK